MTATPPVIDPLRARNDVLQTALFATEASAHATAHDLRTPINTLSGLLHLMSLKYGADLPDKALEYIDYLSRAVHQLDDMTSSFLETSRAASGMVNCVAVDMREAARTAMAEVRTNAQAVDGTLTLTGTSWSQQADPDLLRYLLVTLLLHALGQRDPQRPPRIDVELRDGAHLRITHDGRGFPPQNAATLFLPHKADGAAALGLAACDSICQRHGWQITARSDGTHGATFQIGFAQETGTGLSGFD